MVYRDFSLRHDSGKDIHFQVIDWYHTDFVNNENDDIDDTDDEDRSYIIKMFGVNETGNSVCLNVTDFKPFFYISHKNNVISPVEFTLLEKKIRGQLPRKFRECLSLKIVKKKSIWGFTNNEKKQFIKLSFTNLTTMYMVRKKLRYMKDYEFHESNIDPFLRFIHIQDIKSCGWVYVKNAVDIIDSNMLPLSTKCQINISASYDDVTPYDYNKVAPVVILSFDIECTSSTGDFPVPIKTYKKTAEEIINLYNYLKPNNYLQSKVDHYNWNDSDFRKISKQAILDIFREKDDTGVNHRLQLTRVIPKNRKKINFNALEQKIQDPSFINTIIEIINDRIKKSYDMNVPWPIDFDPTPVNQLEFYLNNELPALKGDAIIQIGTTVHKYGDTQCTYKNIITLGTCDTINGVEVISCKTEKQLIEEWCKLLDKIDPDIITGYNILGFDFTYLYSRAQELNCETRLLQCGRLDGHISTFKEKVLSSSALGDNILKYVEMEGRVIIDLMKVVQREYKLDTYKLDNVASHFISGKIKKKLSSCKLQVDSTTGINKGDYIKIDEIKYMVNDIENDIITINEDCDDSVKTWGLAKDDVTPKEIFECQKGTSKDRAKIAKYCVQDCALCNMLIIKLEVFANNMGMSNVCLVPLSYIFMRGQGVKIFSLVVKQCRDDGFIVPVIKYEDDDNDDVGYEGAIVLDPVPGIYTDAPISVMDYASLYPSSMISENISHDSIVLDDKYDNLEGIEYVDITYDIFKGVGDKKVKDGVKVCRFAQFPNNEKGILPRILMKLLSQRKSTRKQMTYKTITTNNDETYTGLVNEDCDNYYITCNGEKTSICKTDVKSIVDTYNDFMKAVLDGLQLAYKITANSLYGQVGARTSPIYMKELAASTTATGRNLIIKAKEFMEKYYDANVVYGDTDSIFVDFTAILRKYGLTGKAALEESINIAVKASSAFKETLKAPHDLEYEKTFWPFIILSKKKYVGNLYEFDVNKYKQKSMGIVLKRRDNANIVKLIYGGIIDILLGDQDIIKAIQFLQTSLKNLVDGKYQMDDLIITKTLRSSYKDPSKIAHKVLADRMRDRDPGSAPQVNDRVQYVYIEHDVKNKSLLQGDKIEDPRYIKEKSLNIDYIFYITNQLLKPICQLLSVALYDIPKCKKTQTYYDRLYKKYFNQYNNTKKASDKISDLKQHEVKELLFDEILNELENKRVGQTSITKFFQLSK